MTQQLEKPACANCGHAPALHVLAGGELRCPHSKPRVTQSQSALRVGETLPDGTSYEWQFHPAWGSLPRPATEPELMLAALAEFINQRFEEED